MSVSVKYINYLLLYALSLLCGTMFFGCNAADNFSEEEIVPINPNLRTYITLNISTLGVEANTRTNPTGGNDGDGREEGINNENNIYDLTFFLYESSTGDGINGAENPTISMSHYIGGLNFKGVSPDYTYKTAPIEVKEISITENTYIIVVVNGGDWTTKGITTLDNLRGKITYEAVVTTATNLSDYTRFVMASATTASFTVTDGAKKLGTYEDPAHVTTTVERLAARIDIIPRVAIDASNTYYEYDVTGTSDKVRATHITSFNCWQPAGGQYLLKRVSSDGTEDNKVYLAKETPDAGVQTNYVMSCHIANKTLLYWNSNQSTVETWYRNPIRTVSSSSTVQQANYTDAATSKNYYILDYTQENTMFKEDIIHPEGQLNCYTTGIVLQATYIPATVYDDKDAVVAYTAGTDFYYLDGKFYNYTRTGAVKYTNGICYYRYYIRHSNDNVLGTMGLMEYGVVRNNIYRLEINSFSGVGHNKPDPEDPKEDDEYINIDIEVRPWSTRTHDPIEM